LRKLINILFLFQSNVYADVLYKEYNEDIIKHTLSEQERTEKEKVFDDHFLRLKEKQLKFILLKRGENILNKLNTVPYLSREWHLLSVDYENYLEGYKQTMENIKIIKKNR